MNDRCPLNYFQLSAPWPNSLRGFHSCCREFSAEIHLTARYFSLVLRSLKNLHANLSECAKLISVTSELWRDNSKYVTCSVRYTSMSAANNLSHLSWRMHSTDCYASLSQPVSMPPSWCIPCGLLPGWNIYTSVPKQMLIPNCLMSGYLTYREIIAALVLQAFIIQQKMLFLRIVNSHLIQRRAVI